MIIGIFKAVGFILLYTHRSKSLSPTKKVRNGVSSWSATRSSEISKYRLSPMYYFPDYMEKEPEREQPTQTSASLIPPPMHQSKPKIVVLGATGRVGRRIIKLLMASGIDMIVVAFVRNHDKACDTLYDDGMLLEREMYNKYRNSGPKLQLVIGDLVPPQEVFGYTTQKERIEDREKAAYSAARFYGSPVSDFLKKDDDDAAFVSNPNQALMDAIEDATIIISSVGTVRATWPFADYFWRPWRIFRSPKLWCDDPRHPYYVNYHVMKKVLSLAEAEQLRRDSLHKKVLKDQEDIKREDLKRGLLYDPTVKATNVSDLNNTVRDRIKIIRISDLCVALPAWSFVSVLTNIFRSIVFQSQDLAEMLLEHSEIVDTVIIRPGDLSDENRNVSTTNLQIDTSGIKHRKWSPSYVGRDDVAALVAELALANIAPSAALKACHSKDKVAHYGDRTPTTRDERATKRARHITVAVRWAGDHLLQGRKRDGFPNAQACVQSILKQEARVEEKLKRLENISMSAWTRFRMNAIAAWNRRRMKPYGVFVFVPMIILYPVLFSIVLSIFSTTPLKTSLYSLLSQVISLTKFSFDNQKCYHIKAPFKCNIH